MWGIVPAAGQGSRIQPLAFSKELLPVGSRRGYREESAAIGTLQTFALASGMVFVALYKGFLNGTNALLFGSFLGITAGQVALLAANIDDMSPQLVEPLMTALLGAGALDAWATSILMKKGRPALEISALAPPATAPALARIFFEHSTTLGVRQSLLDRTVLTRSKGRVETRFGSVSVKVAALGDQVLGATPEFEDCRRLAASSTICPILP